MADTSDTPRDSLGEEFDPSAPQERDDQSRGEDIRSSRVGDQLRRERLTRRVGLDTIARDLKLNVKYIKAIEENRLDELPAPPYIRVYLRSIAKYLGLDAEKIISRFYKEQGIPEESADDASEQKITISFKETKPPKGPWVFLVVLLAVLGVLVYFAYRSGLISFSSPPASSPELIESADPQSDSPGLIDTADTAAPAEGESPDSIVVERQQEESIQIPMRLRLDAVRDSVWVQVFSDGSSWKNYIYPSTPRSFSAQDSLNLHVGNSSIVRYQLNGRPMRFADEGVVYIRIAPGGVETWDRDRWLAVFRNRL